LLQLLSMVRQYRGKLLYKGTTTTLDASIAEVVSPGTFDKVSILVDTYNECLPYKETMQRTQHVINFAYSSNPIVFAS